jgi:hypothetical protein
MKPAIKLSFAKALLRMSRGETLKASEINDKKTLELFVQDGVVEKVPVSRKRSVYRVTDPVLLHDYLAANYQVKDLEAYLEILSRDEVSGADSLKATYHTKTKRTSAMPGFFIKSLSPLTVLLNDEIFTLPASKGTETFITEPENLAVPENLTIIGVENPEAFLKIDRLGEHFKEYEPCLFVLRYMSKGLVQWLQTVANLYLHFGDFDLSGLQIYISEYKRHLDADRCNFFVPDNMEELIQTYGNRELYDQQLHHTKNLDLSGHPEVAWLGNLIIRYAKGLEQEILLEQSL